MSPANTDRPRFEEVTETTGIPVTQEAASMIYTRYHLGASIGVGKRVLELACGGGNGLGLLGATAATLVGGDLSAPLLQSARRHYGTRYPLVRLSAEALPFRNQAFDTVVLFEASYYVPDMEATFDEIRRVLSPGGSVLFANANPDRPDFIRSPHSRHYHRAAEFRAALQARGFTVTVHGAFPVEVAARRFPDKVRAVALSFLRRILDRLGLVPRTLAGRARLKRLVFRQLERLPAELPPEFARVEPLVRLEIDSAGHFKVIYVCGKLEASPP